MQRAILFITTVSLFFISSGFLMTSTWKLRKEDDGIKVYTRPVQGSALDEFKGVVTINVSLEALLEVFKDADNLKRWSPNCEESSLLSFKENVQIQYTISHAPFPMDNRDSYVELTYKQVGQNVKIEMTALPNHKPRVEDLVRVEQVSGYWLLVPIKENVTRVTYQLYADPGGSIPDWLANSASVDTPFNTLRSLRSYAEKN